MLLPPYPPANVTVWPWTSKATGAEPFKKIADWTLKAEEP